MGERYYGNDMVVYFCETDSEGKQKFGAVDADGNVVERSKTEYPYSYNGFVVYRGGSNEKLTGTAYSDRLFQEDHKKFQELCKKYFKDGVDWSHAEIKNIEAFLKDWMKDPKLELVLLMEHCNWNTGAPLWSFGYHSPRFERQKIALKKKSAAKLAKEKEKMK